MKPEQCQWRHSGVFIVKFEFEQIWACVWTDASIHFFNQSKMPISKLKHYFRQWSSYTTPMKRRFHFATYKFAVNKLVFYLFDSRIYTKDMSKF